MPKEWKIILNNTNKNINLRPIAFFDSGVGGLTVFEKVKKLMPHENYLYFGDTKNMPYGEKTEEQLLTFADKIFKFFEKQNAKAVVMACNTTSAITYEKLKNRYGFKIYPIIQSVCKSLADFSGVKHIAVIATPATVKSHAYSAGIKIYSPETKVFELAAPEWVKIVEEHRIDDPKSVIEVKNIIEQVAEYDKIVLACTHYPYLSKVMEKFVPAEKLVDPSVYFARIIRDDLDKSGLLGSKHDYERFFVSSSPQNFKTASEMFYQLERLPELVEL